MYKLLSMFKIHAENIYILHQVQSMQLIADRDRQKVPQQLFTKPRCRTAGILVQVQINQPRVIKNILLF